MRILVLSNLYPPHILGGYEIRCFDTVNELRSRGHNVHILTSNYGRSEVITTEVNVTRTLHFHWFHKSYQTGWQMAMSVFHDLIALDNAIRRTRPDVIHIWNVGGLWKSLVIHCIRSGVPVVFDISDYSLLEEINKDRWIQAWQPDVSGTTKIRLARWLISRSVSLERLGVSTEDLRVLVQQAYFTSRAVRERYIRAGYTPRWSEIIYCGVATEHFFRTDNRPRRPVRLLCSGNIRPEKGTHTAIEALGKLAGRGVIGFTLTIVGDCKHPDYLAGLKRRVEELGLTDCVTFMGAVPREAMPAVYEKHDILLFTSIWPEPFALTVLEAMAAGLAIISTATGGSVEILRHGENALVFSADDHCQLAEMVEQLSTDAHLYEHIRHEGNQLVRADYTLERMVEHIETFLRQAVERAT